MDLIDDHRNLRFGIAGFHSTSLHYQRIPSTPVGQNGAESDHLIWPKGSWG